MVITRYKVKGPKLKLAVVADLHGEYSTELIETLKAEKPDIIACPGDLATVGEYDDNIERRCGGELNLHHTGVLFLPFFPLL